MEVNEYTIISGTWPGKGLPVGNFLDCAAVQSESSDCFQLFQTYSECRLEDFNRATLPDPAYLEQYRAFCEDWELWIRNINSRELRFRFICGPGKSTEEIRKDLIEKGCKLDGIVPLDAIGVKATKYPLWGEPLEKGKNNDEGWYTTRIPQIISYPVDFPKAKSKSKVFLKVENFMRKDGSVEIVRYSGVGLPDTDGNGGEHGGI